MMTTLEGPAFSQGTNIVATNIKRPITKYNTIDIFIESYKSELSDFDSVIYDKQQYIEEHEEELIASATNPRDKDIRIKSIKRAKDNLLEAKEYMEAEKTKLAKFKKQASTTSGKVAYTLTPSSEDKLKARTNQVRQVKEKNAASQVRRLVRHSKVRARDEREKKRLGEVGDNTSSGNN